MKAAIILSLLGLTFSGNVAAQSAAQPIRVDTTITKFHLAADFQGTLVYTLNGPADINKQNPTAFSITRMPNASIQDAKDQLEMLLNLSRQNGYAITDLIKRDTLINGVKAFIISYKESIKEEGYFNFVFNGILVTKNVATIFTSGDLNNGKYTDLFKKTFYAIKL
ncbi:hypothetical protein [Flaviaesturariibacter terrae]